MWIDVAECPSDPGTILLTADTLRIVEGFIEVKPLGPVPVSVEGLKTEASNIPKIRDMLASKPSGSPFKATVLRAGKIIELTGRVP